MFSITSQDALTSITRIACAGVTLSSVELLFRAPVCFSRGILAENGGPSVLPARFLGKPLWQTVLGIRLLAAVWAFALAASLPPLPLALLLGTSIFLYARNPPAVMAADQMNVLTFAGLTAAALGGPASRSAALWFIALQASLSYATAGFHKVRTSDWRKGIALRNVFNTRTYGDSRVSTWMHRYPALAMVVAWPVILWECLFPLALLNPYAAVAATAAGVGFHLGTSAISKLNHFVWAFGASYPAVLFCSLAWSR